jgi:hypothetical protein
MVEFSVFAQSFKKLNGYIRKNVLQFELLKDKVSKASVGATTSLWNAIGKCLDTMPRDAKYSDLQREVLVLTDGYDTSSKSEQLFTTEELQKKIEACGKKGYFTILGVGSDVDEAALKSLVASSERAAYMKCSNNGNAIKAALAILRNRIVKRQLKFSYELEWVRS